MNKKNANLILILLVVIIQISYGQTLSKQVMEYVAIKDSIVAIKNATLIDGSGNEVKYNQDILLVNDRIVAIGQSNEIDIPESASVIDGKGKTVIPGLIMMHEHLFHAKPFYGRYKAVHMPHTFPQMYLAGGVTTMRTAGSFEVNTDLNIKNLIDDGQRVGPDIDVSTPHMDREGFELFLPQLKSLYDDESIENWLNYWFDKGVTSVKVYNNLTKADLAEIIRVSHARNIKVTGHLCSITHREAAELGIDNLEHSFSVATDFVDGKKENECVPSGASLNELDDDDPKLLSLMNFLIEKNVTLTYTPVVVEPYTDREVISGGGDDAMAPYLLEQMRRSHSDAQHTPGDSVLMKSFFKEMKRVKKFHSLGGKLTVGSDPTYVGKTIAGYSNQRTIEVLVETGFSIQEAIKIATYNGAEYIGLDHERGTVEVGKRADLVLINGDLAKDVSSIRNMEIVFKNGVGYDSEKIFDSVKGKVGAY
jgi:imidazolonepropionase-like amidohydrolase